MLYFIKPKKEKRFWPMMNTSRKTVSHHERHASLPVLFELLDNIEP